jgi:hypothetical protein
MESSPQCKKMGAKFFTHTPVNRISRDGTGVTGVDTQKDGKTDVPLGLYSPERFMAVDAGTSG